MLNNITTATITLYKIEESVLYQSELISTNGNIFHPYDMETQLNFNIFSNNQNITKQFLDIEWLKFSHGSDKVLEDKEWGQAYYGKDSINITKGEIDKKCIIQVNAYMTVNNARTCVASSRITLIDINDIYSSSTPPENPIDGSLWVNTGHNPPTILSWNSLSNKWVEVGQTTPAVRNLMHNSNFWKLNTDNYIEDNIECLEDIRIITMLDKKWASLVSRTKTIVSSSAGLLQETKYPIIKNSSYTFSFLAYKQDKASYTGSNIYCKIISLNDKNKPTNIITTLVPLKTNQETQISIPFKTLNDTSKIKCFIGVEPEYYCNFYITELSLYNTSGYYPWESSPEDIQEQVANKLDSDHQSVFNALTRNGTMEGIYINEDDDGKEHYYFNASHIKTGSIDGGLINGIGLNIKDDLTGDSIFHVYKDENGTHIDMIANNLLIGTSKESASTVNYVNESMKTAEENAINSAETYTDGKIDNVNKVVNTKANSSEVQDLEKRVTNVEDLTEEEAIVKTVTSSQAYIGAFNKVNKDISNINGEIDDINKDITNNIKTRITDDVFINAVTNSKDYKDDLAEKVNVKDFNSYTKDLDDSLSSKFSTINTELNKKATIDTVNGINSRVQTLEDNVKASSIVQLVRNSTEYKADLNNKTDKTSIISTINSSKETIKISKDKLDIDDQTSPLTALYTKNSFSNNNIVLGNTSTTPKDISEVLDNITITPNADKFSLTLIVNGIKNTNYVKVSDNANIYMNNNEMIKLLLYEVQNLKARIAQLEK